MWPLSTCHSPQSLFVNSQTQGNHFLNIFERFISTFLQTSPGFLVKKRPPKLSLYCFKVARTSIFLGIPFTFGPLIHKQLVIYCKIIITRGLQIGLKFIMILFFRELKRYHVTIPQIALPSSVFAVVIHLS